jgi:hypothetical protein
MSYGRQSMCVGLPPNAQTQKRKKSTYLSTFEEDTIGLVGRRGCDSDTQKLLQKHKCNKLLRH